MANYDNTGFYITRIRNDHKFSDSDFVLGKIIGYADVICYGRSHTPIELNRETGEYFYGVYCTEEEYGRFSKMVEEHYPGLCEFNYVGNQY